MLKYLYGGGGDSFVRGTARVQRATVEITFVRGRRAPRVGTKGRLMEPVKERHVDFHLESSSACTWNHHHDQLGMTITIKRVG